MEKMAHPVAPDSFEEDLYASRTEALAIPEILGYIASFLMHTDRSTFLQLRFVSRTFERNTFYLFRETFFSRKRIMYTPRGLQRLRDLAGHSNLLERLRNIDLVTPGWNFCLVRPTTHVLDQVAMDYIWKKFEMGDRIHNEGFAEGFTQERHRRVMKQWAEFLEINATMYEWLTAWEDLRAMEKVFKTLGSKSKDITFRLVEDSLIEDDPLTENTERIHLLTRRLSYEWRTINPYTGLAEVKIFSGKHRIPTVNEYSKL